MDKREIKEAREEKEANNIYLGYFADVKNEYIIPIYVLGSTIDEAKTKLKEIKIAKYHLIEDNIKYHCKLGNLGNIRDRNRLIKNGYIKFKKER